MSDQPLLDDLLIESGGNIILSNKSPEYKKNRFLLFLSLGWLYVLGWVAKIVFSGDIAMISAYIFLSIPSTRLLHAWCTNIPIFLYKEVVFLPKAIKLLGRYPWVKDKFYDLDYDLLTYYHQTFFSLQLYQFWGTKDGQNFRISRFTNLFNKETITTIAAYHKIQLIDYSLDGYDMLFIRKKKNEEIYWHYSYFYTLIILSTAFLSLPAILAGFFLIIYIPIFELAGKSIVDIFGILGGLLVVIFGSTTAAYAILIDKKYHKKIKQFILSKGITIAPKFIIIHYRFRSARKIVFDEIRSIKEENNKVILETDNGIKTMPLSPFYDIVYLLERFYKKE
jgi:hypothetical protein